MALEAKPESKPYTWILLRGLAREKQHWGGFTGVFQNAFPRDQVLTIDLPGAGEFRSRVSPGSMTEIFNFVRSQAVERARAQSQFKIFAVSLGGMVAMEWMKQKPEDLAACVLVNSSSKISPFYHRLRWQIWREVARLLTVQSARERERGVIQVIMNSAEARESALPSWTKIAIERPMSYFSFLQQLRAAANFQGLVTTPRVPVLLLNGLGDRLCDPSCSEELARQWSWPMRRHPWAGHDLTWDDPQWVIDQIQKWDNSLSA